MRQRHVLVIAAIAGGLAVLAGTFGAHVLKDRLDPELLAIFETGVRYHMYHSLALLGCAALAGRTGRAGAVAVVCFTAGIVVFAGSLYALALTGWRGLGAVTPVGGVLLLAGWAALVVAGVRAVRPHGGPHDDAGGDSRAER